MQTLIYDPNVKEASFQTGEPIGSWKDLQSKALSFLRETVAKRRAAGEARPDLVPVIHRKTGDYRLFNFWEGYQGSIAVAESCLTGAWRLATKEEELAWEAKNEAARDAATNEELDKAERGFMKRLASVVTQHSLSTPAAATVAPQNNDPKKGK